MCVCVYTALYRSRIVLKILTSSALSSSAPHSSLASSASCVIRTPPRTLPSGLRSLRVSVARLAALAPMVGGAARCAPPGAAVPPRGCRTRLRAVGGAPRADGAAGAALRWQMSPDPQNGTGSAACDGGHNHFGANVEQSRRSRPAFKSGISSPTRRVRAAGLPPRPALANLRRRHRPPTPLCPPVAVRGL